MIHHFGICLRRVGVLVLVGIAVLSGCRRHEADGRLARVAGIVSAQPEEALRMLGAVDRDSLREADRHYYDLLSVKAADKAYITHVSDSTVLDVINYYASHGPDSLRAESLYYGGRVYRDMGDYPTSLRYFQSALDMLPEDTPYLTLRAHTLSQTGRVLNTLRLYEQAIPYIEESIRVDSVLNDSLGLMFDTQLLGAVYLYSKQFDKSEYTFEAAKKLAKQVSPVDAYQQDVYLALLSQTKGDLRKALNLIRHKVDSVHPDNRSHALSCAATIYFESGLLDTAYVYAREILKEQPITNRITGYHVILSPQLRDYVDEDSIYSYVTDYMRIMETSLNQNGAKEALIQNSQYNYKIHERERLKLERIRSVLLKCIVAIILVMLALLVVILYLKVSKQKSVIRLHEALDNLNILRQSLTGKNNIGTAEDGLLDFDQSANSKSIIERVSMVDNENLETLRGRIKKELLALQRDQELKTEISSVILLSTAYSKLQTFIEKGKIINETNEIWKELEDVVIKSSNEFNYRLKLLMGENLKRSDYHLALLIKCGVSPTQMTILLGKAKGTISYRREALCVKMFGEKMGVKVVDDIIRSL